jgi:DNA-binding CsgD family transcriptional regulator
MDHPLLRENEGKRLDIGLPRLCCFAMFAFWQMGVVYFSGGALSLDGRTPLPVSVGNMTALVAAGYVVSIGFFLALPQLSIRAARVCALAALGAALALYLPVGAGTLAGLYYLHCFLCVCMIIFENALIVQLFTEKTAVRHLTLAYALSMALVGALQNDLRRVPFSVFHAAIIAALVLQLVFYRGLPAGRWPRYAGKADGIVLPRRLFAGLFGLVVLSCLFILFGAAAAESAAHGVMVFYLSMAVCGLGAFVLWRLWGISPLRSSLALVCLGVLGFVGAIGSLLFPSLALPACVFLGAGAVVAGLAPCFGLVMMKRYPTRWISAGIIGIGLVTVLVHSALLEALRKNLTALYVVYLAIAVGMAVLYLAVEPYLLYSFRTGNREDARAQSAERKAVQARTEELFECLTGQELRTTELLLQGYSYKAAAASLGVTMNTVKSHVKSLYAKLNIHSARELFVLAEQRGNLPADGK